MTTPERVVDYFTQQRDQSMAKIEEFAKKVMESPIYTMEWSDKYFMAAAEHWVAISVLEYFKTPFDTDEPDRDEALAHAAEDFRKELLRMAGSYPSSTSIASNHADNCRRVAIAKAFDILTR